MELTFNKNSWHYKLYRLMYGYKYDYKWNIDISSHEEVTIEPTNLCPYFWKTVIAFLLVLPILIFKGAHLIYGLLWDKQLMKEHKEKGMFYKLGEAVGCWLIVFVLFSMIYVWFIHWNQKSGFTFLGILGYVIVAALILVIGSVYLHEKITDYKRERRMAMRMREDYVPKEDKPSLVVEFIKASYNKYCPGVNWKE